ncbi:MAG TPA: LamG domain-containing protein [Sedimentisphaerales bacterium]|nr:LamG domain-containing protein [Sedimentisphaerales bacterium]
MSKKLIYLFFFVLVLSIASNASAELVAHWPLDEGSGTTAYDISGNGLDGTLQGDPQWVAGKIGGALEFDGNGDYIDCGNDPIFDITEQITLTVWVNANDMANSENNMWLGKGDNAYAIKHQTGNYLEFFVFDGDWHSTQYTTNLESLNGDWHHMAGTFDGTELKFYLDGQLEITLAFEGTIGTAAHPVTIGENSQEAGRFFDGMLDDLRIYNHALTELEIMGVMEGSKGYPYALGPVPAGGAIHPDTWVNLSWAPGSFAVSHDVYLGDNFDDVNAGAEGTFRGNQAATFIVAGFPGFAFPDGLVPGTTYYWRIDEVNDTEPNSPWKGNVWSFSIPPKTAYYPEPAEGAELVDPDVTLSWTGGFGSKLHYVYFGDNFDDVSNAAGALPQGTASYTPGTLKLGKIYYWRVDEFDVIETHKGDIWSFTTQGAVVSLKPSNGAVDVKQTQILTWSPGVQAASHEVYFGTDKEVVRNADTGSPEYKGTRDLGSQSYDPGKLEWDVTYYWRIDEVNNTNADSPWVGPVWSFTTANFLIVDDFESYNDLDPADPDSNRIFNAWIDGYDDPANGSLVGYETPPFAEQTIIHSGNQSMPLYYDNSVGYSEATLTLTYPRDWTEKGVTTLTIWFRGDSDNAAETLYVAFNGSAVVAHDNPNAAQIEEWTRWNIDLQAFADQGVNLTNVNTVSLGLGNKNNPQAGGSGTMYFDDIRLYLPAQ